ncbi:AAA family ATPase [Paenibacillus polymyxa]|uniref:AAA family ATPase n=1 Tax=Paenibacillus polymyxa TaxID=1406 RepID=UPI0002DA041A|nr:AAA family ATPase [Paenibacillus polymyxa]NMP07611.1 AAA family ATPase [Paenibacillus polymyxa]
MSKFSDRKYLPIRFLNLETEGFSFFPRQEIPLHSKINGIIGVNGSGKTTLLNMMRVLIGSKKFDNYQSLQTFFERDEIDEIYIVGRFDNKVNPSYGRRPFEAIGKRQDIVSVICRIKRDTSRREYCVYDGNFDLEHDLQTYIRWIKVEQYAKQMQEVGLTRSLINACSLSQGNTEQIMDLTEEELADYILQICGEQERIDQFNQIKIDLKAQKEQYFHIEMQKQREESTLREIENNLNLCKKIVDQQEQLTRLHFELPISQYANVKNEQAQNESELRKLIQDQQRLKDSIQSHEESLEETGIKLSESQETTSHLSETIRELNVKSSAAAVDLHNHQRIVSELNTFMDTYRSIPLQDLVKLTEDKLHLEEDHKGKLTATATLRSNSRALENKITRMETTHKNDFPTAVIQMRQWLESQNIQYLLIADCIEIQDEFWREAFEAMLGSERFTIVVDPKDMVYVMKTAQENRYPFWVSPFKPAKLKLEKHAILNKVTLTDDRVAGYLQRFDKVMVATHMEEAWSWINKGYSALLNHPSPYYVVANRGGRSIRSKELCCGRHAYEAQLREYKRQYEKLKPLLLMAENEEDNAFEKLSEVTEQIRIQQQRLLLPSKEEELVLANRTLQTLQDALNKVDTLIGQCSEQLLKEIRHQNELSSYSGILKTKLHANRTQLEEKNTVLEDKKSKRSTLDSQIQDIKKLFNDEQKLVVSDTERMKLILSPDQYEENIKSKKSQIEFLRNNLTGGNFRPGEEKATIRLEKSHEKHRILLDQHLEEIKKIKHDLEKLEEKRVEAKKEYQIMVDEVFQKVRKALEEMSKHGDFDASLRAVYLDDERWKVDYRLGFNGKPIKSYRDKSSLSGGQKVIASLLLTFAAIKADGVLSFMILDEPFAHLDEERIALAGQFLSQSDAQIIIGMPYSENIKLMMPWVNMLLNFRPKARGENVAPPITYGEYR